ncbi:hypothetical protein AX769_07980 [Frondihabitans sp. PAMC 28766]|uniref:amidohydrolase family protein n=1 Tax=Frondihabitans sp. PAMC 28766 TaxID=1795630 RepID=UPI00078EC641|nr:hypothetical protein [Frondihabitans sp. PAMC 28766]AMM20115.1 hypothetical protein AX769_07980 [Frondihabitans sp. PAMC 28766]
MHFSSDDAWFGGWRGPSILRAEAGRLTHVGRWVDDDTTGRDIAGHVAGAVLAPFTDSHVHLGLVDPTLLRDGGIGRVLDLGWDPAVSSSWPARGAASDSTWPEISIAGGLHSAPGGYPARSGWAPPEAALPIVGDDDVAPAVKRAQDAGASVLKITLNTDAGPVWDDALLARVVDEAHAIGLPVVAHAQGLGQVRRAARARVDVLAHTPWSERLDDDLLADLSGTMTWISTLAIHSDSGDGSGRGAAFETAVDNLARFHALGGHVLYGTDLGNGPLPIGLNAAELEGLSMAGLDLDAILHALTPGSSDPGFDSRLVMRLPSRPGRIADLAAARVQSTAELARSAE